MLNSVGDKQNNFICYKKILAPGSKPVDHLEQPVYQWIILLSPQDYESQQVALQDSHSKDIMS